MADELKVVKTATNEFEADVFVGLLSDAGIRAMQRLGGSGVAGRIGGGGERDVCVSADDFDRAREVLEASQGS